MIWREKRIILIVFAALLAINIGFFVTYRVRYEQRIQDLDQKLSDTQATLARARADHVNALRTFNAYKKMVGDIEVVYNDYWSTPDQRLTALIVEIKRLATQSDLIPQTTSYSEKESKNRENVGTLPLEITFAVQGPYAKVRQLISLLELSKQFVSIDSISLNSNSGSDALILSLHLKTLFRDTADPARSDS